MFVVRVSTLCARVAMLLDQTLEEQVFIERIRGCPHLHEAVISQSTVQSVLITMIIALKPSKDHFSDLISRTSDLKPDGVGVAGIVLTLAWLKGGSRMRDQDLSVNLEDALWAFDRFLQGTTPTAAESRLNVALSVKPDRRALVDAVLQNWGSSLSDPESLKVLADVTRHCPPGNRLALLREILSDDLPKAADDPIAANAFAHIVRRVARTYAPRFDPHEH